MNLRDAALTDSGERLGVDGRVVHDDDEEDGEGEEDGDAERDLLAAGGRQPEDAERDDGHEDDGHHDVVPVVLRLALPVDGEAQAWILQIVLSVELLSGARRHQLPQRVFLIIICVYLILVWCVEIYLIKILYNYM